MNDLNDKIAQWLKTNGQIETIKKVKQELQCNLAEAKEIVDKYIKDHPDVVIAKANNTKNTIITLVVLVAVIWIGCNLCGGGDDTAKEEKTKTRKERIEALFSQWDGSQDNVVKYIKQNIKDPDSYKHLTTKFIDQGNTVGIITEFTATNSFGGRVKSTCVAKIDTLGNLISAELVE